MEGANSGHVQQLAGDVVERDMAPPPPIKKSAPRGFPQVKPTKKKIIIKKPKPVQPEESNFEMMEDALPESANPNNQPLDDTTPRFDFDGNEITGAKETEETILEGLHSHGDNPEKPGYALYELALLSRSRNNSQRAFAFEVLYNTIKNNPKKYDKDIRELQIPLLTVISLFPPTNNTIKSFAIDLMKELLFTQYQDMLSIYPYPAIPPVTSMTLEFAQYTSDLVSAANSNYFIMNVLSLLTPSKQFDISSLESQKPSIPLFRLARSAFISWGTVFAKKQALEALEGELEIAKESASLLCFLKEIPGDEVLAKLHPVVLSILLSRTDDVSPYVKYIDSVVKFCPDPFVVSFLASFTKNNLLPKEVAKKAIEGASFSPGFVTLSIYAGIPINVPEPPKEEHLCWVKRAEICGIVEYIIKTKDLKYLPQILPCLYSFTNPAADILVNTIFGFGVSKERPVDPYELFEHLLTIEKEKIEELLKIALFFPLRYILPLFNRNDGADISDTVCEFLDHYPDPLPADSLRPIDCSTYFERFLFDCFEIPSYQKFAYFCISPGADPEVRQHFWTTCSRYLSRIKMQNVRKDVIDIQETDKEVLASIYQALRESQYAETDLLNIAIRQLSGYMELKRGEIAGEVFFANCQKLQEVWKKKLFAFLNK
ncbi:RNA polymerase II-associated protein 1 [Histomonas meleagridis]|uniref:RNA polymerase II-associated protein 1 n=1 Tax=Histomonas meleagridis TaxID=135588 RepID=UPI00355A921C|nr:RNA polymerase II-associated protein 1 [Histomonas meleagridis]KAH0804956.1 RNA polymerase II-associated protein 1 [Histomonas meleagridis]